MHNDRMQECISINKNNIDIIGNALEEYLSLEYHNGHIIDQINDARVGIKKIR